MNLVCVLGRLTKDPELRVTPKSNKEVVSFSIAVDVLAHGERVAEFHDCVAWSKSAELIGEYFKKGDRILIKGELRSEVNNKDGKRYTNKYIQVDKVDFIEKKKSPMEEFAE